MPLRRRMLYKPEPSDVIIVVSSSNSSLPSSGFCVIAAPITTSEVTPYSGIEIRIILLLGRIAARSIRCGLLLQMQRGLSVSVRSCLSAMNQSKCRSGSPRNPVECTLAPPGEYDWTIRARRRCGLTSNYNSVVIIILRQMLDFNPNKPTRCINKWAIRRLRISLIARARLQSRAWRCDPMGSLVNTVRFKDSFSYRRPIARRYASP